MVNVSLSKPYQRDGVVLRHAETVYSLEPGKYGLDCVPLRGKESTYKKVNPFKADSNGQPKEAAKIGPANVVCRIGIPRNRNDYLSYSWSRMANVSIVKCPY